MSVLEIEGHERDDDEYNLAAYQLWRLMRDTSLANRLAPVLLAYREGVRRGDQDPPVLRRQP